MLRSGQRPHQAIIVVAIPAKATIANARTRGRDPAEADSDGIGELVVSVAAAALFEISISVVLLGSSFALSRLVSVVVDASTVEVGSAVEVILLAGVASDTDANFSKPPVRVTTWYERVKSAPVSPLVLVVVYSVESPHPDCFETVHLSMTERLISHTLE